VEESLALFRGSYKLWLIKAQLLEEAGSMEEARQTYEEALTVEGVKLEKWIWLCYAEFEAN
jgi:hypothetical protein